ncbi:MAG TPA: hypothetical protein VF576_09955 [Rubricoccaceae bacterium]|jgi:hypothetical protein
MPSPRSALLVSLFTFQSRLWLGGLVAAALVPLSILAAALDWVAGRGPESGHYARVRREASAVDTWLGRLENPDQPPDAPVVVRDSAPDRAGRASA